MDLRRYKALKTRNLMQLVNVGSHKQLVAKQFDPNTADPIDDEVVPIRAEEIVNQIKFAKEYLDSLLELAKDMGITLPK